MSECDHEWREVRGKWCKRCGTIHEPLQRDLAPVSLQPAPSQTGTPRTDALLSDPLKFDCEGAWFAQGMTGRLVEFARQLERELAEAKQELNEIKTRQN